MLGIIEQQRATEHYRYLIGIDLGEELTAVSFTRFYNNKASDIEPITRWPRQRGNFYPKTPTLVTYNKSYDGENYVFNSWGRRAYNDIFYSKDKKNMLHFSFANLFSKTNLAFESKYGDQFPVKRLVADFLKGVVDYVKTHIQREERDNIHNQELCYCIAVPTTWDDDSRSIVREAAIEAGIIEIRDEPGKLILTSEKEAIAATLDHYCANNFCFAIESNEIIVICNADDTAVDVATYKVAVEGEKEYFEELTHGYRKSGGASHIDNLVRLWVQGHLDQFSKNVTEHELDCFVEHFRKSAKIDFEGEEDDPIYLPLPVQTMRSVSHFPGNIIVDGYLRITPKHLSKYIFDPVINQTLELINQQLMRIPLTSPARFFLVGQFSSSIYFSTRIREAISHRILGPYVVPWDDTVCARGAICYGLNPSPIIYRVALRSYGVRCNKKFRDGVDDPANLVIRQNGQRRCRNRLDFFVKKNTRMSSSYCFEREYSAIYPKNTRSILYSFNGEGDDLPDYVDNEGVEEVLRFNVEMPVIPGKKHGDKIPYKTRIHIGLTEIKVEVLIGSETQVHVVSLLDQQSSPSDQVLYEEESMPGFDEMIEYFQQQDFETDKYRRKTQSEKT